LYDTQWVFERYPPGITGKIENNNNIRHFERENTPRISSACKR
jgi:hypothetical protein